MVGQTYENDIYRKKSYRGDTVDREGERGRKREREMEL